MRLAEIVVSDVDAIPPRSGDRVVHLVDAVVLVHKADSPLGRARIALLRHLHDELVATGSTLGVARVLGEDEERNFHAVLCGSRGLRPGPNARQFFAEVLAKYLNRILLTVQPSLLMLRRTSTSTAPKSSKLGVRQVIFVESTKVPLEITSFFPVLKHTSIFSACLNCMP